MFANRCKRNCDATVNPSEGLVLESEIDSAESAALVEAQYQWHVYERDEQEDKSVWREVIANDDTKINELHLLENTLHPGNTYKVSVVGMVPGRTNGYSELVFSVNIPPSGGSCSVDQTRGYSDETIFSFKCEGWTDEDLPLSYEFQYRNSYGVVSLLYDGIAPVFFTKLPLGDVENNFTLDFQVKIFDSHKTYSTSNVDVKVCESIKVYVLIMVTLIINVFKAIPIKCFVSHRPTDPFFGKVKKKSNH